jgi:type I restriction enzyme S subunit
MPPWKKVKFGDVAVFKNGKMINFRNLTGNYPVYGGNGVVASSPDYNSENETLIIGRVGAFCGNVYYSNESCWVTDNAFIGKAKSCANSKYLYFLIKHLQLNNFRTGSSQPLLNQETLNSIDIILPDSPTQSRIASILSAFDDKIELNRQMNNTLEQMAQALYKKYFVTVIDPDNLPEGWKFGKIGEVIEVSKTTISPSIFPEKIFLHYSIPAFDINKMASKESGLSILSNKFIVKSNSILFSKLNPRFPRVWMIGEVDEKTAICSTEFLVIIPIIDNWYSFIYLTLCSNILIDSLTSIATGTSGSHQRIRLDDILQTEIIIPSETDSCLFERNVRPNLKRIIQNNFESEILTSLRDSLLPKLMNGEIPVDSVSLKESPETIVA